MIRSSGRYRSPSPFGCFPALCSYPISCLPCHIHVQHATCPHATTRWLPCKIIRRRGSAQDAVLGHCTTQLFDPTTLAYLAVSPFVRATMDTSGRESSWDVWWVQGGWLSLGRLLASSPLFHTFPSHSSHSSLSLTPPLHPSFPAIFKGISH